MTWPILVRDFNSFKGYNSRVGHSFAQNNVPYFKTIQSKLVLIGRVVYELSLRVAKRYKICFNGV